MLPGRYFPGPRHAPFLHPLTQHRRGKPVQDSIAPEPPMKNQASPFINRRFFLRSAGVTLALPLFESLSRNALGAGFALGAAEGAAVGAKRPMRMVCVGNALGFHPPAFYPTKPGRD